MLARLAATLQIGRLFAVAVLLFTASAPALHAQMVNGDFETGDLTGWTITSGSPYIIIVGTSGPPPVSSNAVLLAGDAWTGGPRQVKSIQQSFIAGVGDTLQFDVMVLPDSNDGEGEATFSLTRPGGVLDSQSYSWQFDWWTDGFTIDTAGEHSLEISGIGGFSQNDWESSLVFVDNVRLIPFSTESAPILPGTVQPGSGGAPPTFVFDDVPSGQWFDPPMAEGFRYEMTDGSLFTGILDFPTGFDAPFTVAVGDTVLGQYLPGESVDFTAFSGGGVSSFQVMGLDPGADPNSPTAFPLKLLFNTSTADFTMQAILEVPEPGASWLLASGGIGVVVASRLRRRTRGRK